LRLCRGRVLGVLDGVGLLLELVELVETAGVCDQGCRIELVLSGVDDAGSSVSIGRPGSNSKARAFLESSGAEVSGAADGNCSEFTDPPLLAC
jgi:hypothetical protein